MALEDIWKYSEEMVFSRYRNKEELWGGCKGCYYESSCLAGCTWTSHVLFGKRGNNPFCHHRALELKKKGLKERVRKIQEAPGDSFDMGLFEIIVEDENGVIVEIQSPHTETPVPVVDVTARVPRIPKALKLCNGCDNYVYEEEEVCSFCNSNVKEVNDEYAAKMEKAKRSLEKLEFLMMK
jgi:hypothetical protein